MDAARASGTRFARSRRSNQCIASGRPGLGRALPLLRQATPSSRRRVDGVEVESATDAPTTRRFPQEGEAGVERRRLHHCS